MATIQADQYALPAVEIVPHMLSLRSQSELEKSALEVLRTWNYILASDSVAASIYTTFLQKLEILAFEALLGDDETLLQGYLGRGSTILSLQNDYASRSKPLLIRLLEQHDDSWFTDSAIPNGPRSWDTMLSSAFIAAVEELREKLGPKVSQWQYGKIHTVTYSHPLGMVKPLDKIFTRGPYPFGGDIDTVCMGATLPNQLETVITAPSYRQIVNMADLPASLSGHSPGQSGHPGSKHYDDFIKPWLKVEPHPMLFERDEIEAQAEGMLYMQPK